MTGKSPCPVCAGAGALYAVKNRCSMHRCARCGLIFMHPMPQDSLAIYQGDYFSGATEGFGYTDYDRDKQAMAPTFRTYLQRIARHAAAHNGKRLLDVGAATGFFMDLARAEGWNTAGIEPSAHAAELARKKGLSVLTGILDGGKFAPESFDVVTLWDVIEHLPDPVATLRIVSDLLRPGGIVAINTPDASSLWARIWGPRWHLLCPPEHLCLFSREAMNRVLDAAGFTLLERDKIGKSFTIQYVVQTLAHWQGWGIWNTSARFVQRHAIGQWSVPLNLFDNVFVLARKSSAT